MNVPTIDKIQSDTVRRVALVLYTPFILPIALTVIAFGAMADALKYLPREFKSIWKAPTR